MTFPTAGFVANTSTCPSCCPHHGLSRNRIVDYLLYDINCGFRRYVTGGRGNPDTIDADRRFPGLGQPSPGPFLIRANSEAAVAFDFIHSVFPLFVALRLTDPARIMMT
jgi:hypothetical protein